MKKALMDELKAIVAQEPWNEDDLVAWADKVLFDFDLDDNANFYAEHLKLHRQEIAHIATLKPSVTEYRHDPALPILPNEPSGSLHGIGFMYDEDRDDRVLVAITQLKDNPDVVVLKEHEGILEIYTRLPTDLTGMSVYGDEWTITEFVPYQGRWTEVDGRFMRKCVAQVLGTR